MPLNSTMIAVALPEIARESGCHYVVNCTVSKPSLVEKVIRNAVHIAREIGPTYLQLYTPCILEIGKNSMEGLQEMRDSEKPAERFAYKEYVSEPAKQFYLSRGFVPSPLQPMTLMMTLDTVRSIITDEA